MPHVVPVFIDPSLLNDSVNDRPPKPGAVIFFLTYLLCFPQHQPNLFFPLARFFGFTPLEQGKMPRGVKKR